jgi:hypothetical protein
MILTPRLSNSGFKSRRFAEFGRADRRKIARVRKQNAPMIA